MLVKGQAFQKCLRISCRFQARQLFGGNTEDFVDHSGGLDCPCIGGMVDHGYFFGPITQCTGLPPDIGKTSGRELTSYIGHEWASIFRLAMTDEEKRVHRSHPFSKYLLLYQKTELKANTKEEGGSNINL